MKRARTYQRPKRVDGGAIRNPSVREHEVMSWSRCTLDTAVRLEIEVSIVWRGDDSVHIGARKAIVVSPFSVRILVCHRVEAGMVAFHTHQSRKSHILVTAQ